MIKGQYDKMIGNRSIANKNGCFQTRIASVRAGR